MSIVDGSMREAKDIGLSANIRWLLTATVLVASPVALADASVVAPVQTLAPNLPQGLVYVEMVGVPSADGGGCPNILFVGLMSDGNFKSFVFPTLLAAKATGQSVRVTVSGCYGEYPIVVGVQYEPLL
jgi:hypothetical protein